jgi:hypothetical protein
MKRYFTLIMTITILATLYLVIHRNYIQFNSIVSIKNTRWQKVRVQVRKGYNPDPYHDKLIFDQYLTMGQSRTFTVDNGDDILYRRDSNPRQPDGVHFTSWTYANCANSSGCIVEGP